MYFGKAVQKAFGKEDTHPSFCGVKTESLFVHNVIPCVSL